MSQEFWNMIREEYPAAYEEQYQWRLKLATLGQEYAQALKLLGNLHTLSEPDAYRFYSIQEKRTEIHDRTRESIEWNDLMRMEQVVEFMHELVEAVKR